MAKIDLYTSQIRPTNIPTTTGANPIDPGQASMAQGARAQAITASQKMVDDVFKAQQQSYAIRSIATLEQDLDLDLHKAQTDGRLQEPNFAMNFRQSVDTKMNEVLDNVTDEDVKKSLFMQLGQSRRGYLGKAAHLEHKSRLDYIHENAIETFNIKANEIVRNPSSADSILGEVDSMVKSLEPALGARALEMGRKIKSNLAAAKIQTLLSTNPGAALAEMDSGKYDAMLSPGQSTQLRNLARVKTKVTSNGADYIGVLNKAQAQQQQLLAAFMARK